MSISQRITAGWFRFTLFNSASRAKNEKAPHTAGLFAFCCNARVLLGGHFFGFAFLAHHFEFALGFLEGSLDFLLDLGCRFFQLR